MAKENLSIQIEYEKKEGGVVLKKLHGRCAELHVPAKIDGLPVIAVAERAFAAEKEAPPAEIGEEKEASLSFVTEPPAETAEVQRKLPTYIYTTGQNIKSVQHPYSYAI